MTEALQRRSAEASAAMGLVKRVVIAIGRNEVKRRNGMAARAGLLVSKGEQDRVGDREDVSVCFRTAVRRNTVTRRTIAGHLARSLSFDEGWCGVRRGGRESAEASVAMGLLKCAVIAIGYNEDMRTNGMVSRSEVLVSIGEQDYVGDRAEVSVYFRPKVRRKAVTHRAIAGHLARSRSFDEG